jgi:hypothetical protein
VGSAVGGVRRSAKNAACCLRWVEARKKAWIKGTTARCSRLPVPVLTAARGEALRLPASSVSFRSALRPSWLAAHRLLLRDAARLMARRVFSTGAGGFTRSRSGVKLRCGRGAAADGLGGATPGQERGLPLTPHPLLLRWYDS